MSLDESLARAVLRRFGVAAGRPADLSLLQELLAAYTRTVPWESAFRIARWARTAETADCPRWPAEFWQDALERGGGGTCFESNYAFFSLLRALGYDGYLTINNMGDNIGCHTAIVVGLAGRPWLVDVGLPLYAPIPLDPAGPAEQESPFHHYTIRPDGPGRYQVERDRHPMPNCFTLVDQPVPDSAYRAATTDDYGPNGRFLNRVIVTKVIGEQAWRFNSSDQPYRLESFHDGRRFEHPIDGDVAAIVASHFDMDEAIVRTALKIVMRTED